MHNDYDIDEQKNKNLIYLNHISKKVLINFINTHVQFLMITYYKFILFLPMSKFYL